MTRYMPKGKTKKQMGGFKRPKFLSKLPKLKLPKFRSPFRKPKSQKSLSKMNRSSKSRIVAETTIKSQHNRANSDSNGPLPSTPSSTSRLSKKLKSSHNSSNDPLPSIPLQCDSEDKAFNTIIDNINTTKQYKYIDSNLGNKKLEEIEKATLDAAYVLIKTEYTKIINSNNNIITLQTNYPTKNRYQNIKPNINTIVVLQKNVTLPHTYSHIHYTAWPDHGVPETTIDGTKKYYYDALHKIIEQLFTYKTEHNNKINVLVHCSAGVGRTGTFIMMCYLYNEIIIKNKSNIDKNDIVRAILLMRILRNYAMVQAPDQFKYIMGYCDHLLEITPQGKYEHKNTKHIKIELNVTATDEVDIDSSYDSSYINANYINKNCSHIDYPFAFFNKIIAAQGPLLTTIDDFNKMIAQEGITHVIMVTNLVEKGKDKCAKYFTEKNETPLPNIKYNNKLDVTTYNDNNYIIRNGTITFKEPEQPQENKQTQQQPPPVDSLQKPDELEDKLSNILQKKTIDEKNGVAKFLNLLRSAVEDILRTYYSSYKELFIDPYCIKIKLKHNTHISIYIINKKTGNICAHIYTIPNENATQSEKKNHNDWVNWLMYDINKPHTVEFYLYGKMIEGDQIVKNVIENQTLKLTLPYNQGITYTRKCNLQSKYSVSPVLGGARKYRSKKANNNKRSKVCKTKKRKC